MSRATAVIVIAASLALAALAPGNPNATRAGQQASGSACDRGSWHRQAVLPYRAGWNLRLAGGLLWFDLVRRSRGAFLVGIDQSGRVRHRIALSRRRLPEESAVSVQLETGPAGALWVSVLGYGTPSRLFAVSKDGAVTKLQPPARGEAEFLAPDRAGGAWFTMRQRGKANDPSRWRIGYARPGRATKEFIAPGKYPVGRVYPAADGGAWFTRDSLVTSISFRSRVPTRLGHISPNGEVTELAGTKLLNPTALSRARDGGYWAAEDGGVSHFSAQGVQRRYREGFGGGDELEQVLASSGGWSWYRGYYNRGEAHRLGLIHRSGRNVRLSRRIGRNWLSVQGADVDSRGRLWVIQDADEDARTTEILTLGRERALRCLS